MKTLFLIDGAYQEAKSALSSILYAHRSVPNTWRLIEKFSTKLQEGKKENDLIGIKSNKANDLLMLYSNKHTNLERVSTQYFCYNYPDIEGKENFIYCIDTERIDNLIEDTTVKYGFLIVRNPQCINDLILKYEQNGRLNVVPVFLYTDYTYIKASKNSDNHDKWKKLWDTFVCNYQKSDEDDNDKHQSGEVIYESVLIFNAEKSREISLSVAESNLTTQLKALVKRVKNKNKDLVVVTDGERTFIPEKIREHKHLIESLIKSPNQYRKSIFVMMKFHDEAVSDRMYQKIKDAVVSKGYLCIRADDVSIKENFPDENDKFGPSVRYWLATFLCKRGIAIFEKDGEDRIILNPNIAYEMGIMKQQGKHVDIFVPDITPNSEEKLFFDVDKDSWKNKYNSMDDLIEKIKQCF